MTHSLKVRLGMAVLAACGSLFAGSAARAQINPVNPGDVPSSPAVPNSEQPAPAVPRGLLMQGLDKLGVGSSLDNAKITIGGFAEGSWTYSASSPPNNFITGRVFDTDNEDLTLNQIDLFADRPVDAKAAAQSGSWDWGFHVEGIYGGDSRWIHSNGLNFYGSSYPQPYPDEQVDLVQAYADIALPVGNGLRLRVGKFVTLMGAETINPTANSLFSHSYLFGYAIPFTETGVLATYAINDKLTVDAGITRGWNQTLQDNNGDTIDFLGRVSYALDENTNIFLTTTIGPEATGDPGNWFYVFDGIVTHKIGDQLSVTVNADYGLYTHGSANGTAAQWYGIAAYGTYTINKMFAVTARGEWYDDNDGFTLAGTPDTVYEATLGVSIKPMPEDPYGSGLVIRPEVRYDYSDKGLFDAGTDHYQWTAGVDVIYSF